jgi:phage/plasmid-associated DNA primase
MFLSDRCVCLPNARAPSNALYKAYRQWAEEHGEAPMSHKLFASCLSERGFKKTRQNTGVLYVGVGLMAEGVSDQSSAPTGKSNGHGASGRAQTGEEGEIV